MKEDEYSLELTAVMLNINPGHNQRLMESCKTLRHYSQYVAKVWAYYVSLFNNDIPFLEENLLEARVLR